MLKTDELHALEQSQVGFVLFGFSLIFMKPMTRSVHTSALLNSVNFIKSSKKKRFGVLAEFVREVRVNWALQ